MLRKSDLLDHGGRTRRPTKSSQLAATTPEPPPRRTNPPQIASFTKSTALSQGQSQATKSSQLAGTTPEPPPRRTNPPQIAGRPAIARRTGPAKVEINQGGRNGPRGSLDAVTGPSSAESSPSAGWPGTTCHNHCRSRRVAEHWPAAPSSTPKSLSTTAWVPSGRRSAGRTFGLSRKLSTGLISGEL